jgi:hypothetical protein
MITRLACVKLGVTTERGLSGHKLALRIADHTACLPILAVSLGRIITLLTVCSLHDAITTEASGAPHDEPAPIVTEHAGLLAERTFSLWAARVVTGLALSGLQHTITTEAHDPTLCLLALRVTDHAALLAIITVCRDHLVALLAIGSLDRSIATEASELAWRLHAPVCAHLTRLLSIRALRLRAAVVVASLAQRLLHHAVAAAPTRFAHATAV